MGEDDEAPPALGITQTLCCRGLSGRLCGAVNWELTELRTAMPGDQGWATSKSAAHTVIGGPRLKDFVKSLWLYWSWASLTKGVEITVPVAGWLGICP